MLRNKWSVVALMLLLALLLTTIALQFNRYALRESPWRFESFDSCISLVGFYVLSLLVISNFRMSSKASPDRASENSNMRDTVRHAVFEKFVAGMIYLAALSVVLFPVLARLGFNLQYMLCSYLYVIGFGSLCLLPVSMMREMSNTNGRNTHALSNILPLLLLLPAIGGYVLITELVHEKTWHTAVALIGLSIMSLMLYKPMALALLKRYDR